MDQTLKDAAESGSVDLLYKSIQENPSLLDQIDNEPFVETPLHVAPSLGNTQFSMEIMGLRPSFVRKLDLNGFTPLHLALQNEKTYMVNRLVGVESDLVRVRGREGITPLHIVAGNGNHKLLKKFLSVCQESIQDVTIRGETALHLTVKNKQLEAFKVLVEGLVRAKIEGHDFAKKRILNWTDDEGNSLLHIAALTNQTEVVKLLLLYKVKVNEKNSDGLTALDIAGLQTQLLAQHLAASFKTLRWVYDNVWFISSTRNMTEERRNTLLVVATLIVTATYQAALSPPGGLWQDFDDGNTPFNFNTKHSIIHNKTSPQIPGRVTMNKRDFLYFWRLNTATLLLAVCCILLPALNSFFVGLFVHTPIVLILFCYGSAMSAISRDVVGGISDLMNHTLPYIIIIIILLRIFFINILSVGII